MFYQQRAGAHDDNAARQQNLTYIQTTNNGRTQLSYTQKQQLVIGIGNVL